VAKNKEGFVDPEIASIAANTLARKVEEIQSGEVSKAVILATSSITQNAIQKRAAKTVEGLNNGQSLTDVIIGLERIRIKGVETKTSASMSKVLGKKVEFKVNKVAGGGRRSNKTVRSLYVLDPDIDISVTIDGEQMVMEKLAQEVIPNAVLKKDRKVLEVLAHVGPAVGELLVGGHTLTDLVVPVATAAVMGKGSPEELAQEAVAGCLLATGGLPGSLHRAEDVARLAMQFYKFVAG
jgi:hypothetical protein